ETAASSRLIAPTPHGRGPPARGRDRRRGRARPYPACFWGRLFSLIKEPLCHTEGGTQELGEELSPLPPLPPVIFTALQRAYGGLDFSGQRSVVVALKPHRCTEFHPHRARLCHLPPGVKDLVHALVGDRDDRQIEPRA